MVATRSDAALTTGVDLPQKYLDVAVSKMPVIKRTLGGQAKQSVHTYLESVTRFSNPSWQSRDDLIAIVRDYAADRLGDATGQRVAEDLSRMPVVLTANHHGVDFFAQSIQSSLLFGLRKYAGVQAATVPVFACASIPLNNLTYPRGILIYRARTANENSLPLKLSLFPDRAKRKLVCRADALDEEMIGRAMKRAAGWQRKGDIDADIHSALTTVLEEDYASTEVLAQNSYSDQAVLLNHRIWQRIFQSTSPRPELVYLDLERIAAAVTALDLVNPDSLLTTLLFPSANRERLLTRLDGARACWDRSELTALAAGRRSSAAHGTVFFWAFDDKGLRVPMRLVDNRLVSCAPEQTPIEIPWSPESIVRAIHDDVLMPSLFTSYVAIGLARGVSCLGGYYQAEYLPVMQRAIADVLRESACANEMIEMVERVPTTAYLSGMQAVMTPLSDRVVVPAGALEIIAGGGLSESDLRDIGRLTVHQAHLASVIDTVLDLAPELAQSGWQTDVGEQLHKTLHGSLVLTNEFPQAL